GYSTIRSFLPSEDAAGTASVVWEIKVACDALYIWGAHATHPRGCLPVVDCRTLRLQRKKGVPALQSPAKRGDETMTQMTVLE
ncbi:MAG: hypothetical protein AAGK74_20365, partial [Chloroflexota bacterium]